MDHRPGTRNGGLAVKPDLYRCRLGRRVLISSVIVLIGCGKEKNAPTVRPLETPAWNEYGHLLVRADPNDGRALLLKRLHNDQYLMWGRPPKGSASQFGGEIYRYDARARLLTVVPRNEWNQATSPISDCSEPASGPGHALLPPLVHDVPTKRLLFNGTLVPTAGKTVLETYLNPDNTHVAVLSAEGAYRKVGFPFLGGGSASGRRFHQVFRRADGTEIGRPVVLEETSNDDDIRICWSSDGKTIVYYDTGLTKLWIVPVRAEALEGTQNPGSPRD